MTKYVCECGYKVYDRIDCRRYPLIQCPRCEKFLKIVLRDKDLFKSMQRIEDKVYIFSEELIAEILFLAHTNTRCSNRVIATIHNMYDRRMEFKEAACVEYRTLIKVLRKLLDRCGISPAIIEDIHIIAFRRSAIAHWASEIRRASVADICVKYGWIYLELDESVINRRG